MNKINSLSSKNALKPAPDSNTVPSSCFFSSKWTLFVGKLFILPGLPLDVFREKPE